MQDDNHCTLRLYKVVVENLLNMPSFSSQVQRSFPFIVLFLKTCFFILKKKNWSVKHM